MPGSNCKDHGSHDTRISHNEKNIDRLFGKVRHVWDTGIVNLHKELGNKLNTRLYLASLSIFVLVFLSVGAALWDINDSLNSNNKEITDKINTVIIGFTELKSEVGNLKSDVVNLKNYGSYNNPGP